MSKDQKKKAENPREETKRHLITAMNLGDTISGEVAHELGVLRAAYARGEDPEIATVIDKLDKWGRDLMRQDRAITYALISNRCEHQKDLGDGRCGVMICQNYVNK